MRRIRGKHEEERHTQPALIANPEPTFEWRKNEETPPALTVEERTRYFYNAYIRRVEESAYQIRYKGPRAEPYNHSGTKDPLVERFEGTREGAIAWAEKQLARWVEMDVKAIEYKSEPVVTVWPESS